MPSNIEEAGDNKGDSKSIGAQTADRVIKQEKDGDREGLVAESKQKSSDIKAGTRPSGVTDLLGKPIITGEENGRGLGKGQLDKQAKGDLAESQLKAKPGDGSKPSFESSKEKQSNSDALGTVHRDKQGRVDDVKYPDGGETKIKYDQDGNVSEAQTRNGDIMKRRPDGKYDVTRADGSQAEYKGTLIVDKNGDIAGVGDNGVTQIRHRNGDETQIQKDQSQVTADSAGHVKQIVYPNNERLDLKYDKEGHLSEVRNADGSTWRKEDDGWNRYTNGKKDGEQLQDISVKRDGTIEGVGRDGEKYITKPDGSSEETSKTIQRDAQDRPTSITYPDGKKCEIQYDKDGNAAEIHTKKGDVMKRVGDGQYKVTRADGSVEDWNGQVLVDKNGDIAAQTEGGNMQVRHANGNETVIKPDQSQVTKDPDGQITQFVSADGKKIDMRYENGELVSVKQGDSELRKDGAGWNRYEHGKKVEQLSDVTVTEEGVSRQNKAGVNSWWGADGQNADGY